jgi:hypothetical protein
MRNKKSTAVIISVTLLSVMEMMSCTHTPQTPLVSFSKDIMPILTASCTISGACHMGANGTNLQTNFDPDSAYATIISKGLISTSNPSSSLLYVEVRTNEMPLQPFNPLSVNQQNLILDWIEQGAQNN